MAQLLQFKIPNDVSEGECRPSSVASIFDVPAQFSRIGNARAKAREDIRALILMFDVALMHGRLAIPNVGDQEARQRLEAHLCAIEEMLDLTRVKAVNS